MHVCTHACKLAWPLLAGCCQSNAAISLVTFGCKAPGRRGGPAPEAFGWVTASPPPPRRQAICCEAPLHSAVQRSTAQCSTVQRLLEGLPPLQLLPAAHAAATCSVHTQRRRGKRAGHTQPALRSACCPCASPPPPRPMRVAGAEMAGADCFGAGLHAQPEADHHPPGVCGHVGMWACAHMREEGAGCFTKPCTYAMWNAVHMCMCDLDACIRGRVVSRVGGWAQAEGACGMQAACR